MPRIPRHVLFAMQELSPQELKFSISSILSSDHPPTAIQIQPLWRAISEWELGKNKSIGRLLSIMRSHSPARLMFRKGDTPYLFAARYYYCRNHFKWNVGKVNQRGLNCYINKQAFAVNYHIYYEHNDTCGYAFFKFGDQFSKPEIIATLSTIRLHHEKTTLFPFASVNCLYIDAYLFDVYYLNEIDYRDWLRNISPLATIAKEHYNAQCLH